MLQTPLALNHTEHTSTPGAIMWGQLVHFEHVSRPSDVLERIEAEVPS